MYVCVYICVIKKTGLHLEHKILNGSSAESQTSGGVHLPLNYGLSGEAREVPVVVMPVLEQKRAT